MLRCLNKPAQTKKNKQEQGGKKEKKEGIKGGKRIYVVKYLGLRVRVFLF